MMNSCLRVLSAHLPLPPVAGSGRKSCPIRQRALRPSVLLATVLLLLPLARAHLFAQQGFPPNEAYGSQQYAQPDPSYNKLPPNQQQAYPQQPYPGQYENSDQEYAQQQQPAQPFNSEQIEQMVAPIALYPDTLIGLILAAATYPAQVAAADHWLHEQGSVSTEQIADEAETQTAWDPSVKALTAFPQVLALMDRDLQWTTDLGNAYYNQPQDVLQTVQVMRQRAEQAGTLQNTPQEAISYNQGYIQLAPVNPQVVYVPDYNPWSVYGRPVSPYPGFSLLGALESFAGSSPMKFGLGIAMNAFSHTSFGWMGWALNWLTQSVLFHQSNYTSQSTTVAHWGFPRGSSSYAWQQGGVARQSNSYYERQGNYGRPINGYDAQRSFPRHGGSPDNYAFRSWETRDRAYAGSYNHPAQTYSYNRPQAIMPARPQPYGRLGGDHSAFVERPAQGWAGRPASSYLGQPQNWRASQSNQERENFAQRSYFGNKSYQPYAGRGFAESYAKPHNSGGFHLFGSRSEERSHTSFHAPKAPKAPKGYGGGKHFGGGRSGGHHGGGHHH